MNSFTFAVAFACGILAAGCMGDAGGEQSAPVTNAPGFMETRLVSDGSGAAFHDANLVNAWGIARDSDGLFWIADNGTGRITIVDNTGAPSNGEYRSDQFNVGDGITGIVAANPALDADFMVASESGELFRINGDDNPTGGISFAKQADASYKGIAVETVDGATIVLAANFHQGRVDAFDASGKLVSCDTTFIDPTLAAGYAPFNVVAADGMVWVSYAQQDADKADEVDGPGLGLIDEFDAHGNFMKRFTTGGDLNAPWAMVRIADLLYVGNFGDGHISMFNVASGKQMGQLDASPIDGLWGIVADTPTSLYVAAGPDMEAHGLFAHLAPGTANH